MTLKAPPIAYPQARQTEIGQSDKNDCPCCGRPWDGLAVRVCAKCGAVLGRGHRYRMIPAGRGMVSFEHYNCRYSGEKK